MTDVSGLTSWTCFIFSRQVVILLCFCVIRFGSKTSNRHPGKYWSLLGLYLHADTSGEGEHLMFFR